MQHRYQLPVLVFVWITHSVLHDAGCSEHINKSQLSLGTSGVSPLRGKGVEDSSVLQTRLKAGSAYGVIGFWTSRSLFRLKQQRIFHRDTRSSTIRIQSEIKLTNQTGREATRSQRTKTAFTKQDNSSQFYPTATMTPRDIGEITNSENQTIEPKFQSIETDIRIPHDHSIDNDITTQHSRSTVPYQAPSHQVALNTTQIQHCLLNNKRWHFYPLSGSITLNNMSISSDLLRYKLKFTVPAGHLMSIQISNIKCSRDGPYFYRLYESDNDMNTGRMLFSSYCPAGTPKNLTVYTSANATLNMNIRTKKSFANRNPFSVCIRMTSFPEFYSILQVTFTTPMNGSVSTPSWDGVTSSFWVMNTWIRIIVPERHGVMVSVSDISIHESTMSMSCFKKCFLGLYNHSTSQPLRVYCGSDKPGPSTVTEHLGLLYIRFITYFVKTRFKLLFSFHLRSLMLARQSNGAWNCSVPQWLELRHHFPCDFQVDCMGREDEAPCPYTTPGCGEGRITIAGRCYVFTNAKHDMKFHDAYASLPGERMSWEMAEEQCRLKGGHLASSNYYQSKRFWELMNYLPPSQPIFVGITATRTALPFLYRNLWTHVDGSINHYVSIVHTKSSLLIAKLNLSCIPYEQDGAFFIKPSVTQISRKCRILTMASLCEVPPITKNESLELHSEDSHLRASRQSEIIQNELKGFWWDPKSYFRCPRGHLTHDFLACDVHSVCWARNMLISFSCTSPAMPLPPSMRCNDGGQYVPYTLVCNHQLDCYDHSDEDFCVFMPCDIMTDFECADRTCIPLHLKCDGVSDCNDASDEQRCPKDDHTKHFKAYVHPPLILSFDGHGNSNVQSLKETLSLNSVSVNGTLVNGRLIGVTLIGDTLVNGTFIRGTLTRGTIVSGVLVQGTLVSGKLIGQTLDSSIQVNKTLLNGTLVSGTLVRGLLLNATLVKGSVVNGTLVNATLISGTSSCPDTHFHCSADDYCVPMFTRCNGLYDCPGHEDEVDCDSFQCPGFYRCRGATVCVHRRNMCDGVFHCPQNDDELMCDFECPNSCICYGLAFFCSRVTPVSLYPELRYLDATGTGTDVYDVQNNTMLIHLSLVRCGITDWAPVTLPNLQSLDLSENNISKLSTYLIRYLFNLRHLVLARNSLTAGFLSESTSRFLLSLQSLDLSGADFKELDPTVLSVFPNLHTLNLTGCGVNTVLGGSFQLLKQLHILDLNGNPMTYFPRDMFHGLGNLREVYTNNYKLCCPATLPNGFYLENCKAPSDEVSSCEALLRSTFFRICLYLFAVSSCIGNLSSLLFRLKIGKKKIRTGFDMFVANLCVSDLLMGVYLTIIGLADRIYLKAYLWYDVTWRHSTSCQAAGFLSLLSSEVSTLIICLITLDRFIVLRFPFSQVRFSATTAFLASALVWMICCIIATVPLLPVTSHWQFYSQTGICIPLPINRNVFGGHRYDFSVMIVLNFVLFVMVALGQLLVYMSAHKHQMPSIDDSTNVFKKNQTLARRLITVAVSNFLCWFPIGLVGMMAVNGFQVPSEVNVAMAIFVLPLNSAINPFLYTLNIVMEKIRKSREGRIKQFLVSQIKARAMFDRDVANFERKCPQEEALQLFKKWVNGGILSREYISDFLQKTELDTLRTDGTR